VAAIFIRAASPPPPPPALPCRSTRRAPCVPPPVIHPTGELFLAALCC
jgi:hypothetical protein